MPAPATITFFGRDGDADSDEAARPRKDLRETDTGNKCLTASKAVIIVNL